MRMAATGDRETTISDLPPEILSHIFTFSPYNLRVVRLVCSKWNESCNTEKVSGHDKIVIHGESTESIDLFLSSRTLLRNIYNLRLVDFSFEPHHVGFFMKYGGKLRSLTLVRCSVKDEYVPFLQCCKNLNTLNLKECSATIVQSFRYLDGSLVQTNIVDLRIECDYLNTWSDESLDDCFRICPHLRSVSLCGSYNDDGTNDMKTFSFDGIHHALSIRAANIVKLDVRGFFQFSPEQMEQIASIPNLKLQGLVFRRFFRVLTQRNMRNFVILQPDLQNITVYYDRDILENELADWIERCSKLTHLKISENCRGIVLDRKLLDALTSRSHLRALVLETRVPVVMSDFENSQGTFDHLRTLEIHLPEIDYDCFLARVSANLNHLHLTLRCDMGILGKALEFISNHFTRLETLDISLSPTESYVERFGPAEFHMGSCGWSYNFTKPISFGNLSFGNLKKLKKLVINPYDFDPEKYPTNLLMRFKAPNLQYLVLSGFTRPGIGATSMSDILKNFPSLERVNLTIIGPKDPSLTRTMNTARMCDCKRLSHFYCDNDEHLQLHRR